MTIVCTADEEYFPLLEVFAKSLAANSPDTKLYARLVNCEIHHAKRIESIHKNCHFMFDCRSLCTKRKKLQRSGAPLQDEMFGVYKKRSEEGFRGAKWLYSDKMAYCFNSKFNTINSLFKKGEDLIVYMDVDAIVRKPLIDLEEIGSNYDISMLIETNDESFMPEGGLICPKSIPKTDYYDRLSDGTLEELPYVEWHAGLFTARNTPVVRKFFKIMEEKISDPEELYDWEADQTLLNETYQEMKGSLSVYCLPKCLKDEEFLDDSVVWCGAGEHKFQAEKFLREQQIYS